MTIPKQTQQTQQSSAVDEPVVAALQIEKLLISLVTLLKLETRLALKRIPGVLLLFLLLIPMLLITWLSIAVIISYGVFQWSTMLWPALVSFLSINLLGLLALFYQITKWRQQLTLPETRAALHSLFKRLSPEENANGSGTKNTQTT